LDENFSRQITTFDEVPLLSARVGPVRDLHRTHACRCTTRVLT